jgi:hypothetical protein
VKSLHISENRGLLATSWDTMISTNDPFKAEMSDPPLVIPLWLDPILRPWASTHDGHETLTGPDWPTTIRFPRPQYAISLVDVRAYGWPMRALYRVSSVYTYDASNTPAWRFSGALPVQGTTSPDRIATPGPIILPLLPQPTGFIINTLVWAAIVLVSITAARTTLRTLRARSRRKHNLCPHCAYDRRATPPNQPCPECGTSPPSPAPVGGAGEVVEALRDRRG